MKFDHWEMASNLHILRPDGRLAVLINLCLRSNRRNRCWPSEDRISADIDFSSKPVVSAIKWLLEHRAIELVPYDKRVDEELLLPARLHVYQLTGALYFHGVCIPYSTSWSAEQYELMRKTAEQNGTAASPSKVVHSEVLPSTTKHRITLELDKISQKPEILSLVQAPDAETQGKNTSEGKNLSASPSPVTDPLPDETVTTLTKSRKPRNITNPVTQESINSYNRGDRVYYYSHGSMYPAVVLSPNLKSIKIHYLEPDAGRLGILQTVSVKPARLSPRDITEPIDSYALPDLPAPRVKNPGMKKDSRYQDIETAVTDQFFSGVKDGYGFFIGSIARLLYQHADDIDGKIVVLFRSWWTASHTGCELRHPGKFMGRFQEFLRDQERRREANLARKQSEPEPTEQQRALARQNLATLLTECTQ